MINGIINVYKEKDFTSFDVVALMRGIAGQRKIGHMGTLDPQAEGVLPVALGNATKLCDLLNDKKKEYRATFEFGRRTDTLDIYGTVLEEKLPTVNEETVKTAIASFVGGYDQIPPMFSAKQVNGQRLYDIAHSGRVIERKPVHVDIFEIEIENIALPEVTIRVVCGKGTYIRSLCEDIATKCGELGVMTKLTRTKVDSFSTENAHTLKELSAMKEAGTLTEVVVPTDFVFEKLPKFMAKPEYSKLIDNGNKVYKNMCDGHKYLKDGDNVRMYNKDDIFRGVYSYREASNEFVPFKMFLETEC